MEAAYQKVAARRAQQRPDAPRLSRSSYVRNRSRPPKAVRQAQSGAGDRAQSQPAEQAKAPPGVREPPPRPERHEQPKAAAGPNGEPSSTSGSSSSSSDSDTGKGTSPPAMDPAQDMTAWSRRQVRKTTAAKTRTQRPENTQDSEDDEQGEDASPKKGLKEEEGECPPPEQAEAEPEPGPPAGNPETVRRFDISCRDGPSRVTIRVGFDVEAPAQALLEACRTRSRMLALSSIREPDGITLVLSESVRDQISDGVVRLVADATAARAAASTSPHQGVEAAPADTAQAKQVQPGPPAGASAVKEQPAEASVSDEAPLSESVAKREDEVPASRRPLLSDNCLTCFACNVSVPNQELMGQHMMSEEHCRRVAVFFGLRAP